MGGVARVKAIHFPSGLQTGGSASPGTSKAVSAGRSGRTNSTLPPAL